MQKSILPIRFAAKKRKKGGKILFLKGEWEAQKPNNKNICSVCNWGGVKSLSEIYELVKGTMQK